MYLQTMSTPPLKGFTLIELLVVIAIIGVLSTVVMASLSSARLKGADTAVRANMAQARTQAQLYYEANGNSYASVCTNTSAGTVRSIYDHVQAAVVATGLSSFTRNRTAGGATDYSVCNDDATGWAAQVQLKSNTANFICIDSQGSVVTATYSLIGNDVDYQC